MAATAWGTDKQEDRTTTVNNTPKTLLTYIVRVGPLINTLIDTVFGATASAAIVRTHHTRKNKKALNKKA